MEAKRKTKGKIVSCLACGKPHERTNRYWNMHPACVAKNNNASSFDPDIVQYIVHTARAKNAVAAE
jgi:hypothetical protein